MCSGELIMRFLIEPWRTVICSLYIYTLYYLIETCDRVNTLLQTFFKSQLRLEKPTIPSLEEGELFHFLDNFISEDRKSERTYQNSDSSGIQDTSNLQKVTRCKLLKRQVMKKKINNNSMKRVLNNKTSILFKKGE